jgi:hypothetical protein
VTAAGIVIPALHDAADDQPPSGRQVCSTAAVPICLNPAFRGYLPAVGAALDPVLAEVAGLPGAPNQVRQVPFVAVRRGEIDPSPRIALVRGSPPVLELGFWAVFAGRYCTGTNSGPNGNGCANPTDLWTDPVRTTAMLRPPVARTIVDTVIGDAGPAQRAIAAGVLIAVRAPIDAPTGGGPKESRTGPPLIERGTPEHAAAQRFAALPAARRHAWLAAHLAALRAGTLTLAQLP